MGPGVGGNCIPVDPFYLSWKAKEHDFYVNFIELAANINSNMPHYTVSRVAEILSDNGTALSKAKILVLGVAFKENISDTRNSPALRVMEILVERGAEVSYLDQNVPTVDLNGTTMSGLDSGLALTSEFDAVVILVPHDGVDLAQVVKNARLVIDTRNAVERLMGQQPNVVKI